MVKRQTSVLWIKQLSKEIIVVQKSSIIPYFYGFHINETFSEKKVCYGENLGTQKHTVDTTWTVYLD